MIAMQIYLKEVTILRRLHKKSSIEPKTPLLMRVPNKLENTDSFAVLTVGVTGIRMWDDLSKIHYAAEHRSYVETHLVRI